MTSGHYMCTLLCVTNLAYLTLITQLQVTTNYRKASCPRASLVNTVLGVGVFVCYAVLTSMCSMLCWFIMLFEPPAAVYKFMIIFLRLL